MECLKNTRITPSTEPEIDSVPIAVNFLGIARQETPSFATHRSGEKPSAVFHTSYIHNTFVCARRKGKRHFQAASLITSGSSWDLSVSLLFMNTDYKNVSKMSILFKCKPYHVLCVYSHADAVDPLGLYAVLLFHPRFETSCTAIENLDHYLR